MLGATTKYLGAQTSSVGFPALSMCKYCKRSKISSKFKSVVLNNKSLAAFSVNLLKKYDVGF